MLANGGDSDQILNFRASDLSLHGLSLSHRKDIRYLYGPLNPLL